jgi:hypothetical protein
MFEYDYHDPEVQELGEAITDAVFYMNQDMPNHRQLAFIPSNANWAAKGILDEMHKHSVFFPDTLSDGVFPLRRSYFRYDFDFAQVVYDGMSCENQGYVCEEWPEFPDYLLSTLEDLGLYLPDE